MTASRRALAAWFLYDWAGSAFNTIVVTFVFATYFVRAVAPDPVTGTALWAWAQAGAGLVIALTAAPLGALADRGGHGRWMFALCLTALVGCTGALWFVRPTAADLGLALGLSAAATIAFEIGFVFYNALLPALAPPGRLGRVSGIGWACGYAGGIVCLGACLVLLIDPRPPLFGLDPARAETVRATALFAAIWIAAFGWPVLVFVPRPAARGHGGLRAALRHALRDRVLRRFLLARMLYTDGLTTLFAFGGIFAASAFGMGARQVLVLGIALNVTAGIGAFGFGWVQDRLGDRRTVLLALGALVALGGGVLAVRQVAWFWVLALGLGVFVGPAQAASRGLMARLAPEEHRNAGFGLFALSGRVTGFVGPATLGVVTAAFHSERAGMGVILALLAAGGAMLAATPA